MMRYNASLRIRHTPCIRHDAIRSTILNSFELALLRAASLATPRPEARGQFIAVPRLMSDANALMLMLHRFCDGAIPFITITLMPYINTISRALPIEGAQHEAAMLYK